MAAIILVHGIDNQRESADLIEPTWLRALAGGVRLAGRADLADRLVLPRPHPDSIDCRVAYYGHLFRDPDQQGAGDDLRDLPPDQAAPAEALALEWLERVADRAPAGSADAEQARFALELAHDPSKAQGAGNVLREVLRTLSGSPLIAKMGMGTATRFLIPALAQVSRYLADEAIRTRARQQVLDLVTPDTRAIIGHSLGSVVAYESAHLLKQPLPLLVTVGSPLGLRSIVLPHLSPPPAFPPTTAHWLNLANREDVVAAEPNLRSLFARDVPAPARFEDYFYRDAKEPHRPETYLGRDSVAHALITALA